MMAGIIEASKRLELISGYAFVLLKKIIECLVCLLHSVLNMWVDVGGTKVVQDIIPPLKGNSGDILIPITTIRG